MEQLLTEAPNGAPPYTKPADVDNDTMGGLHIFPGAARWGANSIVPLSAQHFLVIWDDSGSGASLQKSLVPTIVASDTAVAMSVATEEQVKTIQAEKEAYVGQ